MLLQVVPASQPQAGNKAGEQSAAARAGEGAHTVCASKHDGKKFGGKWKGVWVQGRWHSRRKGRVRDTRAGVWKGKELQGMDGICTGSGVDAVVVCVGKAAKLPPPTTYTCIAVCLGRSPKTVQPNQPPPCHAQSTKPKCPFNKINACSYGISSITQKKCQKCSMFTKQWKLG